MTARLQPILIGGLLGFLSFIGNLNAQVKIEKFKQADKFRQLEEILPTPNDYRNAAGAPGRDYWQQTVHYEIDVTLNDQDQSIQGSAKIEYRNSSPDELRYLWLQLDPNIHAPHSDANVTQTLEPEMGLSLGSLKNQLDRQRFDGTVRIQQILDKQTNQPLKFTIVKTMMRIDLPQSLAPGATYSFQVDWNYAINNARAVRGRTGYEFFETDGNYLYELAQWFPRACAYTDVTGWQHKQYLGSGEFTLEFGDYDVRITVPADHIVASTGVLQNPEDVLSEVQRQRLTQAANATTPLFVVTPEEAKQNESSRSTATKTWRFRAERVRDFAFASSRKFIWDALGVPVGDRRVMAMSYYPNEGEPLWSRYSTHAIAHTLDVYSRMTFDYPYPVAISVNGPVGGMEYPMISFNGPRPEKDGTYSARTKYGLISVVIHEVGHNWFPMIVNTDERQWTWMDEGLNTFLQFVAEKEWEEKYPSRRGEPKDIVDYMVSVNQVPIMTNSDSLIQFGENAYAKPATALNILRETIMGRELFDHAFKEYSNRWKFKRPMPADFFRTMEDASGVDLDWFWRGWFYSTDHVDLAIDQVQSIQLDSQLPYLEKPKQQQERNQTPPSLTVERNRELPKRIDRFPELQDFYNQFDALEVTDTDRESYEKYLANLDPAQREIIGNQPFMYLVSFRNEGGLIMPLIVEIEYEDGEKEVEYIPAEIWRRNNEKVSKLFISEKPIRRFGLDPRGETADAGRDNNHFPRQIETEKRELQPDRFRQGEPNPMQQKPRENRDSSGGGGSSK